MLNNILLSGGPVGRRGKGKKTKVKEKDKKDSQTEWTEFLVAGDISEESDSLEEL
jgi:hypothetical protein